MRLPIDQATLLRCQELSAIVAARVYDDLGRLTSVGLERAVLRLLGVEGADADGVPWVNRFVDRITAEGGLGRGAAFWFCSAAAHSDLPPAELARAVVDARIDLAALPAVTPARREAAAAALIASTIGRIRRQREFRAAAVRRWGERTTPWLYVIVATGNIHEDVVQARAAVRAGADVIAVIRSTAQSLLDYIPEGATTEGYGGTFATQENFRIMRAALDRAGEAEGRYVRLTNYASGLCMAEMAALGAVERLDMMLSDSMYGILFRDINMRRTLIDQAFARLVQAAAGIVINTGEDNFLTTDDAFEAAHTVLASQFVNRALAHRSAMADRLIGLGHAFEMDPGLENGLLYEMADALLSRECFPDCPVKFMPPTRYKTGDIFFAHVMDALFALTSVATRQHIHLVGVLTEGIHTPLLHDRQLAVEAARYVHRYARDFAAEFTPREDGVIATRAAEVLARAAGLLDRLAERGLMASLADGVFAATRRSPDGGRGADGVVPMAPDYWNPLLTPLAEEAIRDNGPPVR